MPSPPPLISSFPLFPPPSSPFSCFAALPPSASGAVLIAAAGVHVGLGQQPK
ncbi:hypothetical protein TeGR_g4834, partial [Tetraparma gracilis]